MTSSCGLCTCVSTRAGRRSRPRWSRRVHVASGGRSPGCPPAMRPSSTSSQWSARKRTAGESTRPHSGVVEKSSRSPRSATRCSGWPWGRRSSAAMRPSYYAGAVRGGILASSVMQPIRFHHRGRLVRIEHVAPTRTVLDWLREEAHCTGTKEGCNEGDCGACTVVLGELPEHADGATRPVRGLALKTVNACMQFVPSLHGKALFSVEDLKAEALHPVQQAMVDSHGSQCGFCTPGFVMSLWSAYEQHRAAGTTPSRQQLADELSGNLCRCTGYRPILEAGARMFELPPTALDTAPVIEALAQIEHVDRIHAAAPGEPAFHAPATLEALADLLEWKPGAR